jgi:hypothetical protein
MPKKTETKPVEWPSREEWAKRHRDIDYWQPDIRMTNQASEYASPDEIAEAIAEAKSVWTEMGRQVKAAGPPMTDAEWKRRYMACSSREERDQLIDSPEGRRLKLVHDRSRLNLEIIKPLCQGWLPVDVGDWRIADLHKVKALCDRYWVAWRAANEAARKKYAERPVDDEAWHHELQRRARYEATFGRTDA